MLARQRMIGSEPGQRPLHRSQTEPNRFRELLLGRKLIARTEVSLAYGRQNRVPQTYVLRDIRHLGIGKLRPEML